MSIFTTDDVQDLKADQIMASILAKNTLSDEYLLSRLKAAEKDISRKLKVKLEPTVVFPDEPTEEEKTDLAGKPYLVEPGYDFDPEFFAGERWGRIDLRQTPVISVEYVRWAYPSPTNIVYNVPTEWLRLDKKYGVVQMVPAGAFSTLPLSVWVMSIIGGGRLVPFMVRAKYVTGLADVRNDHPDIVQLIMDQTLLSIVEAGFKPQSGSISADGLSQSSSFDVQKFAERINERLFGPKGSNGGIYTDLHGITGLVW